jgi:diaminopimelate epimerase
MKYLEKWNSIGNDFLISTNSFSKNEIVHLCDRKFGIGADQFVIIHDDEVKFFNSNGMEAEICGNALKCVGQILFHQTGFKNFEVKTKKGLIKIEIENNGNIKINLGKVNSIKQINENDFFIDLGNPHYVSILNHYEGDDFFTSLQVKKELERQGSLKQIEFKETNGINYSIACIKDGNLLVRTFERGEGETLSCGSGSCAAFASCYQKRLIPEKIVIFNLGSKKVLDFKESFYLISYSPTQDIFLEGRGTQVAKIII